MAQSAGAGPAGAESGGADSGGAGPAGADPAGASPAVGAAAPIDPADAPGHDVPGPARRVEEEGGSASVVKWVARSERLAAPIAPTVGFWAAVYARFARHRGAVLAGGLAFFGLLSLVPAALSLGSLVALFYDPAEFAEDVRQLLPDAPATSPAINATLESVATLSGTATSALSMTGLIGLAVSLYAASRFVYVGQQVLDIAFELEPQPPSILSRALAIVVTLVVQVGVVVGVILLTLVPRLLELLGTGEAPVVWFRWLRLPALLILVYVALTVGMRFGTRARRVVGWANSGALLGTSVVLLGTLGLGWYLSVSRTYSQIVAILGGVIALELWLYVVGIAIVVSAEVEGIRHGFRRRDIGSPPAPR